MFGTVLAWAFSFLLAKKAILKLIRQICEDPEAVEALRLLMAKLELDGFTAEIKSDGKGWILKRDERGRVVQIYREEKFQPA